MALLSLSGSQRAGLEYVVTHTRLAKERSRAQALLWLAEGLAAEEVASLLSVSRQTVYNWAGRFVGGGGTARRRRFLAPPRGGPPPTVAEAIDPLIAGLIDLDPRTFGYHSTVWTAPLLMRQLERAHGVTASRRSIGSALDRLRVRWKRPRHQLSLRPEAWRQSKGG